MELETKAAENREIKEAFADFLRAFESFKEANDERLVQIERRSTDIVTDEKVDRINRALDEQKRALDELTLAAARPALGGEQKAMPDRATRERKVAFDRYMRKGDTSGFDTLEMKSLAEGSDGGYVVPLEIAQTIDRVLAKASPIRGLATVQQISTSTFRKPITTTGAVTGWVAETDARTETTAPVISSIEYAAMELYAMPAATQALLDDAQVEHRPMARQ